MSKNARLSITEQQFDEKLVSLELQLSSSLASRGKTSNKAEPWHHLRPWRPQEEEAGWVLIQTASAARLTWASHNLSDPGSNTGHRVWPTCVFVDPSNNQAYRFLNENFCPFFRVSKTLTFKCCETDYHLKKQQIIVVVNKPYANFLLLFRMFFFLAGKRVTTIYMSNIAAYKHFF